MYFNKHIQNRFKYLNGKVRRCYLAIRIVPLNILTIGKLLLIIKCE